MNHVMYVYWSVLQLKLNGYSHVTIRDLSGILHCFVSLKGCNSNKFQVTYNGLSYIPGLELAILSSDMAQKRLCI